VQFQYCFNNGENARAARRHNTALGDMKANIALMVVALFLLAGCGWEQEEAAYDSFAAARDAGAVKRGWIPE
jgi:hypothetical protein